MGISNRLVEFLVGRSKMEHSVAVQTVVMSLGATAFIAGIPAVVYGVGRLYNKSLLGHNTAVVISIVCFVFGLPWMLSAVGWQLFIGRGTPVPIVPTKKILKNGPYRYVRNPMMLGFFLYLLGWTFLFNNIGSITMAAVIILLLILELKTIEEPELAKRFGDAYGEYKKEIPFLLPRWSK